MTEPKNSRPRLGVCYYPEHWPESLWQRDAHRMREAGLSVVRIGEFSWSRIETESGAIDFDWLERAINVLASEGLEVVLGTPTATPPNWLVQRMPDMLAVDRAGDVRTFGSRRHYCFSHQGYREECERIVTLMAQRFGNNPAIVGWQIDNEYGCHDTTLSFSKAALVRFRLWLAQRYQNIDRLNQAWGNVFWSMDYASFDAIELPNATVTEANPAHWMDFHRFSSDQVIAFHQLQADIVRPCSPDRDIIHNFMGRIVDFDHFELGAQIDVSSWDSYPLGFLEDRIQATPEAKKKFLRAGDPDFQAFHHDLYRATSAGRWWIMEQQPGPVNWAAYNPTPRPGMVRLWSWEAFAHGAEVVSYFRWRQLPFGQEQMHAGLLRPDSEASVALAEVAMVTDEIARLGTLQQVESSVCIVFDYASAWAWQIQPQARGFDYFEVVFSFYRGLRRLGLCVDIVDANAATIDDYALVLVPALFSLNDALTDALSRHSGVVLVGPRSGSRTADFAIPASLPPSLPPTCLNLKVTSVDTVPPECPIPVSGAAGFRLWREHIEHAGDCEVVLSSDDGEAALLRQHNRFYVGGWPLPALLDRILKILCRESGLKTLALPEPLRVRQRGQHLFVFNYGDELVDISHIVPDTVEVLGSKQLPASGVSVLRLTGAQP